MSGHSKWANIKHQKMATDAKRGQVFTKVIREIMVAVRQGGSNPESNFKLRLSIQKARDSNMPLDHIERAIKKAAGELGGAPPAELVLEGYAPGGAAILVQALSDNRNRTVQEVRSTFSRYGGSMADAGSVAWLFELKGLITVKPDGMNPDDLTLLAIDVGAEDVKVEDGYVEIYTKPNELMAVRSALEQKNIVVTSAEQSMVPKSLVELDEKAALQTLKLLDKLEELDDVQHVYSNADFDPSIVDKYQSQVPA